MKFLSSNSKYLVLADQALFSGINFALNIALAKLLNLEDFGRFSAVLLGTYLVLSISSAIVIQPAQTGLSNFNLGRYTKFLGLLQGIFLLSIFIVAICIPHISNDEAVFAFGFLSLDFFRKYFIATNSIITSLKAGILLFLLVSISLVLLFFTGNFTLSNIYNTLSISYFIAALIAFYYFRKQAKGKIEKSFLKYHIQHGKWLLTTALAQWWSSNLLVVAAGLYLGYAALGALRLVQSVFGILNLLFQSFENYLIPSVARVLKENKESAFSEIKSGMKLAYLSYLPILVVGLLFPAELLNIVGNQTFVEYGFLVRGFTVLYLLILLNQPLRLLIRSLELNQYFTLGYVLLLLVNLALADFVIKEYQLMGIVIALSLSQLILLITWGTLLINKKHALWKSYI